MDQLDYLKIAKWVALVLVAGFLGQFGKSLAKHFMGRICRRKDKTAEGPKTESISGATQVPLGDNPTAGLTKDEAKAQKKALKALAKQKKKEEGQ